MTSRGTLSGLVERARALDAWLTRRPGSGRLLVDARTGVNYTMFAPVYEQMRSDPRLAFAFMASEDPHRLREIYREAPPGTPLIGNRRAALMKFDAYVASDFMWARLPRGTRRVQIFHGVGGKYGFDAPTESMRVWDRLFFVNRRRLRNCIAAGALDADSPAIRLIGMPKTDALVNGSWQRDAVLAARGLDPALPSVLYAPTWSPESSLNVFGEALIRRLGMLKVNLIVKLHDRSRDVRPRYSGGVDWVARLAPLLAPPRGLLADGADINPYLVAADLMITDHSSCGFEYLLCDRPIVRFHMPELIARASIHPDYVRLMAEVSTTVHGVDEAVAAVERGLADPAASATRRAVAADLFHDPGRATERCARALYELIELAPPERVAEVREVPCLPPV
jgi:CDP-glycerol glycerophosphotransferase (TagB/SpsB family)